MEETEKNSSRVFLCILLNMCSSGKESNSNNFRVDFLKIGLHFLRYKGNCSKDSSLRNAENKSGVC